MKAHCPQAGFSIIELMVSVTILIVILTVGVPSFQTMLANNRTTAAAERIYADMRFARSEALKRNINVAVSVNPGSSWCYGLTDIAISCDCTTANSCMLNGVDTAVSAGAGTNFAGTSLAVSGGGNDTVFNSARGTASQSSRVAITHASANENRISVNLSGRISYEKVQD